MLVACLHFINKCTCNTFVTELLQGLPVWVCVALLFQWFGKVSSLASLGRNYLCDLQANLCLEKCAVGVGGGAECAPLLVRFLSCHTFVCFSLRLPLKSRASFDKAVPFCDWSSRLSVQA